MDNSEERALVFQSVLQNSLPIRIANGVYQRSPNLIRTILLIGYGLKCYASITRPHRSRSKLLYLASYPSEKRVLGRVQDVLPDVPGEVLNLGLRNCFRAKAIVATLQYLSIVPRIFGFARRVVRRYSFMPACRIFSTLPYYVRTKNLIDEHVKAVFIASQYSPECLGLSAAAHESGKRVLFVNHAKASWRDRYVPPIHADLVAVSSETVRSMFATHSRRALQFVDWTDGGLQKPMHRLSELARPPVIGIYLTALTNEKRLGEIVSEFAGALRPKHILIRPHPAKVVGPRMEKVDAPASAFSISSSAPLVDDIAQTDLAICGNSTVAIELLTAGRPVLYDGRLDALPFDYNGYVAAGLMMANPAQLDGGTLDAVDEFYSRQHWIRIIRRYDCAYGEDERKIIESFVATVKGMLGC